MSMREDNDRREYYRIEDTMALEFSLLSGPEATSHEVLQDGSALFNVLSELHLADFESQHLLRNISERDRTLASYLKLTNKRIELLSQALAQTLLREIGAPRKVSLSEGGISFSHHSPVPDNSHIALKLILMPQALGLLLRARVAHCRTISENQYEIGAEFEAITEAQRQLLARHILQRQALERRLARESQNNN